MTPPIHWDELLPGHVVVRVLKEVPRARVVLETLVGGQRCVTRVVISRVPVHFSGTIRELAIRGRGSTAGLPEDALLCIEGYRSAALARRSAGLPTVLEAGVIEGFPPVGAFGAAPIAGLGVGSIYLTTRWVEGRPLDRVWPELSSAERERSLVQVIEILEALHECQVACGDLKPGNVIHGNGRAAFIDLETMREVPDPQLPVVTRDLTPRFAAPEQRSRLCTYLASDIWAFGSMAALLLCGATPNDQGVIPSIPAELPSRWRRAIEACLRMDPLDRPSARQLLRIVRDEVGPPNRRESSLRGIESFDAPPALQGQEDSCHTERVPEPHDLASELPEPQDPSPDPAELSFPDPEPVTAPIPPSAPQVDPRPIDGSLTWYPVPVELQGGIPETPAPLPLAGTNLLPPLPSAPVPQALPPARPASPPRKRRVPRVVLLLVVVGSLLWALQAVISTLLDRSRAHSECQALRTALQRHKTVGAENNAKTLDSIVERAEAARALVESPETLGILALARVWQQRWQFENVKWNAEKYAAGDRLTRVALAGDPVIEAIAARALLVGAGCRLMPESDSRRAESCEESRRLLGKLETELAKDPARSWLLLELYWSAEMMEATEAARALTARDTLLAQTRSTEALRLCEAGWPLMEHAPVNGVELVEDCVSAVGAAGDYPAWLRWSDRLVGMDLAVAHRLSARHAGRVFLSSHPRCSDLRLDKRGFLMTTSSDPDDPAVFCAYMGRVALGCRDRVNTLVDMGIAYGGWPSGALPWEAAILAARDAPRSECPLSTP